MRSPMKNLVAIALTVALASQAGAQLTSQQQRMKDCNAQASGMSGDARMQFMSSCLSGTTAQAKKPHCTKGKLCGNSCIPNNEVLPSALDAMSRSQLARIMHEGWRM